MIMKLSPGTICQDILLVE